MQAGDLLRAGVLDGVRAAVAGAWSPAGEAIVRAFEELGADVLVLAASELDDEEALAARAAAAGTTDLVACALTPAGEDPFRTVVDGCWNAVRAFANASMIPGGRGGKAITVAPPPGGADAQAVRAALENMSRTLSIEWSRYGVRTVSIQPGPGAEAAEIAALAAYLASPGGDYFSGCALALG